MNGKGSELSVSLTDEEILSVLRKEITTERIAGRRVLVLTPDTTRTCPLPQMIRLLHHEISGKAACLDYMVALGTHTPLSDEGILDLYGISEEERKTVYRDSQLLNHRWDLPDTLIRIGWIGEEEIACLTEGRLKERIPVDINKRVFAYDLVFILGPVFPHEVVGFSGGAKYLFPGISGGEFLHSFHWLGAVVTCPETIGIKHTPVREVINRAMEFCDVEVRCFAMVVKNQKELFGLYAGNYLEAWSRAADHSARVHIVTKERPFHTVLGVCPQMYDEIWTGGKVMYKLEQIVADGGRLIIFAPHISEISRTWGREIKKVGYHIRDYFLSQPDRFTEIPRGVLAHSTHVRGVGRMEGGVERPRIEVILASAISEEMCGRINLGYMDPAAINLDDYRGREEEGILFVDKAGEILHRMRRELE